MSPRTGTDSNPGAPPAPLVLVVDDHVDTREGYATFLRMAGFRTAEAENGAIAIKTARELMPDAILLDFAMPLMDGVRAAQCLKRDPHTGEIPIVMLSAFSDVRSRCDLDAYLSKPCSPDAVVESLRAVLKKVGAVAANGTSG